MKNMKAGKSPGCNNVTADEMQAAGKAKLSAIAAEALFASIVLQRIRKKTDEILT